MDVTSIWLKEEFGPKAFFPDPVTGSFQFSSDVGRSVLSFVVNGSNRPMTQGHPPNTPHSNPGQRHYVSPVITGSGFSRPIFPSSAKSKTSVNIKVVQANVTKSQGGKFEFHKLGQTFIDVNESTANVFYITGVVEKKWGREYVLVTSDGLKIEDSSGTQGTCMGVTVYICDAL